MGIGLYPIGSSNALPYQKAIFVSDLGSNTFTRAECIGRIDKPVSPAHILSIVENNDIIVFIGYFSGSYTLNFDTLNRITIINEGVFTSRTSIIIDNIQTLTFINNGEINSLLVENYNTANIFNNGINSIISSDFGVYLYINNNGQSNIVSTTLNVSNFFFTQNSSTLTSVNAQSSFVHIQNYGYIGLNPINTSNLIIFNYGTLGFSLANITTANIYNNGRLFSLSLYQYNGTINIYGNGNIDDILFDITAIVGSLNIRNQNIGYIQGTNVRLNRLEFYNSTIGDMSLIFAAITANLTVYFKDCFVNFPNSYYFTNIFRFTTSTTNSIRFVFNNCNILYDISTSSTSCFFSFAAGFTAGSFTLSFKECTIFNRENGALDSQFFNVIIPAFPFTFEIQNCTMLRPIMIGATPTTVNQTVYDNTLVNEYI